MTACALDQVPRTTAAEFRRADPTEVFTARCQARAILFEVGEFDLHEAVDVLQAAAVASSLVYELGQDFVRQLMAEAFASIRAEDGEAAAQIIEREVAVAIDDDYEGLTGCFARACRAADIEAKQQPRAPARLYEVPASTLQAAEFLVQQGNTQQFCQWLAEHSEGERAAICRHLKRN